MKTHNLETRVTVRVHSDMITKAKLYGIDLAETFRKALDKALLIAKGTCSTCGQKVKK